MRDVIKENKMSVVLLGMPQDPFLPFLKNKKIKLNRKETMLQPFLYYLAKKKATTITTILNSLLPIKVIAIQ